MATDPDHVLVHLSDTDLTLSGDAEDVRGHKVVDRHGEEIGKVDDLVIDPDERHVRFLEVGAGGFLGIGEQKLLIPVDAIERIDDAVHVRTDRAHVAGAPAYDPDLVTRHYYEDLYQHYGVEPFWAPGYSYPPYPFRW